MPCKGQQNIQSIFGQMRRDSLENKTRETALKLILKSNLDECQESNTLTIECSYSGYSFTCTFSRTWLMTRKPWH